MRRFLVSLACVLMFGLVAAGVAEAQHPNAMARLIRDRNRAAAAAAYAQQQAAANRQAWAVYQAIEASRPVYSPQSYYSTPYPGRYSETINQFGNRTVISGNGPYGPFSETISRYPSGTQITGYGIPAAPVYLPRYGVWVGGR